MRLIKKVKFKTVKEFTQFKKIEQIFNKLKVNTNDNCSLRNVKEFSRLNFYIVIEYINLINERINYNGIFPEENIVDFSILIKEQEKLKKYVTEKDSKQPEYFKKLGILNEVVGCFLIATTKKNLRSINNIDFSKKEHSIALKLSIPDLPKEFELLSIEFSKTKENIIESEHKEFKKFMNLNTNEQDNIINETLYNIQFPPILFTENNITDFAENNFNNVFVNHQSSATTIQSAAENTINNIYDIPFLNGMLESALSNENYELCVKIRDRINFINNKF